MIINSCENGGSKCHLCCTRIEEFSVTAGATEILKDVNLHIHCGELTAVIGPNGAGKSTLLKAILGEVKHKGRLIYVNHSTNGQTRPVIGYVPQQLSFDKGSPTSVKDLFAACRTGFPVWLSYPEGLNKRVAEGLDRVQAGHLAEKRLGNLSGGELQRVLLALALDPLPELLLLDEPVSGVDRSGMELFYSIVSDLRKNYDLSIILVSHDLDMVAKYADRVVLLNKTVLKTGTPREVFSDRGVWEALGTMNLFDGFFPDGPGAGKEGRS